MNNRLLTYSILFLLYSSAILAQSEFYLDEHPKPLRNYTLHVGLGVPILFTVSAEVQAYEQMAFGIRYSRQWIKALPSENYPDLFPFLALRFLHGTAVGITASYFAFNEPPKFQWYNLPNRIRTEVALLIPTPIHDISPGREHIFGFSWELLLGIERPYKGHGYFIDIGGSLMTVPGMKPVIEPVFKFGLAINL